MHLKRVVVTGIGALTPIGNNVAEYWGNLLKGKSGASHITYFDTEKFKTKFACPLKNYNPTDHFTSKELSKSLVAATSGSGSLWAIWPAAIPTGSQED